MTESAAGGSARLGQELSLFGIAGAAAFAIDAGLVQLAVTGFDANPYFARVLSFLSAATFTWWFHRRWTFRGGCRASRTRQWALYVSSQLGGFAANYAVFAMCLAMVPALVRWPSVAVAAGVVASGTLNFCVARRLFR